MEKNKTKQTQSTTRARVFNYRASGLEETQIEDLKQCHEHIVGLGRRNTEQTFDLGAQLARAYELVPEGLFGRWVTTCCGFTDRTARNYVAVYKKLAIYRKRLTELGAMPTALFELSKADNKQIMEILAQASELGRLQIKDIKKVLHVEKPKPVKADRDPFKTGGVEGLSRLMTLKIRDELKSFENHINEIIHIIQPKLNWGGPGESIAAGQFSNDIEDLASIACAELCNIAIPIASRPETQSAIRQSSSFPEQSEWEKVRKILQQLSAKRYWPATAGLSTWLMLEVWPALQWAIAKSDPGSLERAPAEAKPVNIKIATPVSKKRRIRSDVEAFGDALDRAFAISAKAAERRVN